MLKYCEPSRSRSRTYCRLCAVICKPHHHMPVALPCYPHPILPAAWVEIQPLGTVGTVSSQLWGGTLAWQCRRLLWWPNRGHVMVALTHWTNASISLTAGDRNSVGSTGSVGSTRSAGSGQSTESNSAPNGPQQHTTSPDTSKVTIRCVQSQAWCFVRNTT